MRMQSCSSPSNNGRKMINGLLVLFCFISINTTQAQSVATPDNSKTSYWKVSGSYLTNSVYYGRQDSLVTPYLTPSIGYYDKSGFYVSGSLSFLMTKKSSGIDLSSLDMGYEFTATDKFSGVVYANKSWYNQSSSNIKSDIKGSLGTSLNYDLNAVQIMGEWILLLPVKQISVLTLVFRILFFLERKITCLVLSHLLPATGVHFILMRDISAEKLVKDLLPDYLPMHPLRL